MSDVLNPIDDALKLGFVPLDISEWNPEKLLRDWFEIEEALSVRSRVGKKPWGSSSRGGADTRVHDWVSLELKAWKSCYGIVGLDAHRIIEYGLLGVPCPRFADCVCCERGIGEAIRLIGMSKTGFADTVYESLLGWLRIEAKKKVLLC